MGGVVINQADNRYNLILLVGNSNYYGQYGCEAVNEFGVASKSLHVSAYADEAEINPVPVSATPWLLQIEWTAKSETPITIFRAQFMAVDERDWSEVDVTSTQLTRSHNIWYGKAQMDNLRPNTQYMVQVSSLNNEGYSKFSEISIFSTPKEETYQNEAVSSSGISLLQSISILTNLLVFSRVWIQ